MADSEKIRLVQTLILNDLDEVLLVKWDDGPNKGRYTGCLGEVGDGESDEASAVTVVQQLVGLELQADRLKKVAGFDFVEDGDDDCHEVEFVYRASRTEATKSRRDTDVKARWFKIDEIPYSSMPADDAIWYPLVLRENYFLSGTFRFVEDRLLDFQVQDAHTGSVVCRSSGSDK
mmetsp:Transcript_9146/g.18925  ORF Transcript_9146/g.18925 Transcript_9146/m.18925 type:complete len:175 (+) Transcript_9146:213-737(+)|eukprot:CAMPEP_0118938634 /NCGR_PEP_ID=MMETSP1169-20130426/26585_1 /TAXON_ID=36882 /ORGANISM="Pyramimonas obovata, Strain CCMP722" /LENGTH=174 /DNA_ID=CAMNT_0006882635 /DNA_START=130 /DNA_END=654 /DNA_ORIENTATION=-